MKSVKSKGVANLIEVKNPNRAKIVSNAPVELSRKVKEELGKEKRKRKEDSDLKEGKSDIAKSELQRLTEIRKKREEAAKERELELKKAEDAKKKSSQK